MSIRFVQKSDMKDICRIEMENFGADKNHRWSENDFLKFFGKRNTRCFVIDEGEASCVGFVIISFFDDDIIVINRLSVDKNYRRNGFGSQLLEKVAQFNAKYLGRTKVHAYILEKDVESQLFLKAREFKSKIVTNHFGPGDDAVLFSRG